MRNQDKGFLFALAAALLWSTVASAFKLTLRYVDHLQLLFYSSLVSTVVLGLILGVRGELRSAFAATPAQYRRSIALGFTNPFAYYLILFKAYDLLPAQLAQPLNFTWGLTLPLLSIPLLKRKLRARDFAALILGYAGVVVISTRGHLLDFSLSDPLGVALAVGSAFVWALYWIYNTKDDRPPVTCLFLSFLFGVPFALVVCVVFSHLAVPDVRGWVGCLYVGVIEMSVTFVLWLLALRLSENTARVSMMIFVSPFFSLVFIHFLVGEDILPSTVAGLLLIVAGLVLQRWARRRPPEAG